MLKNKNKVHEGSLANVGNTLKEFSHALDEIKKHPRRADNFSKLKNLKASLSESKAEWKSRYKNDDAYNNYAPAAEQLLSDIEAQQEVVVGRGGSEHKSGHHNSPLNNCMIM